MFVVKHTTDMFNTHDATGQTIAVDFDMFDSYKQKSVKTPSTEVPVYLFKRKRL